MPNSHPHQKPTHHHRRYSWPPSLHLIDVSKIDVPLPDINEEPFAHFVSTPPPEEDIEAALDVLAYSAGIDTSRVAPLSRSKEKAFKFRTSITLKFARLIGKYLKGDARRRGLREAAVSKDTAAVSGKEMKKRAREKHEHTLGHAQTLLAESDASRKSGKARRMGLHRQRHSWHAPSNDLYTIMEE